MIERPIVFYNKGQQLNGVLHSPTDSDALCPAVAFFTDSQERKLNRIGYSLKQRENSPP